MCHEWWLRRRGFEEREVDRALWDEFERTRPLSDTEAARDEADVTPEKREPEPARNSQDLWIGVSRDLLITTF